MRQSRNIYRISFALLFSTVIFSCRKSNDIDEIKSVNEIPVIPRKAPGKIDSSLYMHWSFMLGFEPE